MKKIKFTDKLSKMILIGEKTSTWRLFDDKDLQIGDELILVNKESGEEIAEAVIEKMQEKKLRELDDYDWAGHERYDSDEVMLQDFQAFYPDQKVKLDTPVKIINFKIIKFLV